MVKRKLKFYFLWEVSRNFHIRASWPSIEKLHVISVYLTLQFSVRPFWKCHIVSKFLVKRSLLEISFLEGYLKVMSTFWPSGPKLLQPVTSLKVTFLHGYFLRFLNSTNGIKSHKASHMFSIGLLGLQLWMSESCERFIKKISGNKSRKDVREVKKIMLLKKCIVYDNLRKSRLSINQHRNTSTGVLKYRMNSKKSS